MNGTALHCTALHCTVLYGRESTIIVCSVAGLASAYYAVKRFPAVDITVYDTHEAPGVGQGASTAPVTLLHPFTPKGKVIWKGLEGFQSMLDIMSDTNYSAGMMPGADDMRIIRPFFSSKKFSDYKRIMDKNPHVRLHATKTSYNAI